MVGIRPKGYHGNGETACITTRGSYIYTYKYSIPAGDPLANETRQQTGYEKRVSAGGGDRGSDYILCIAAQ